MNLNIEFTNSYSNGINLTATAGLWKELVNQILDNYLKQQVERSLEFLSHRNSKITIYLPIKALKPEKILKALIQIIEKDPVRLDT